MREDRKPDGVVHSAGYVALARDILAEIDPALGYHPAGAITVLALGSAGQWKNNLPLWRVVPVIAQVARGLDILELGDSDQLPHLAPGLVVVVGEHTVLKVGLHIITGDIAHER